MAAIYTTSGKLPRAIVTRRGAEKIYTVGDHVRMVQLETGKDSMLVQAGRICNEGGLGARADRVGRSRLRCRRRESCGAPLHSLKVVASRPDSGR